MNNKIFVLGLVLIIVASFVLALQVNLTTKKTDSITATVFEEASSFDSAIYFADSNSGGSSGTCGIYLLADCPMY